MLERYGRFLARRARPVLAVVALVFAAAGLAFSNLGERMNLEVFVAPGTDAQDGKEILERTFDVGDPNVVLLVTAARGTVDAPAVAAEARELIRRLRAEPTVTNLASYWGPDPRPDLRSDDGNRGLVTARIRGDGAEVDRIFRRIEPALTGRRGAVEVRAGGPAKFVAEGKDVITEEVSRAELATGPVTLLALLVVFGSLVAALIPLGMAALAIVGTGAVLWLLSFVVPISSFALFFTSILGLGLSIDYSLFIVNRFREELAARGDVEAALVVTLQTAGRTVLFSAIAVAVALAGLLLLPLAFMRSMGLAGIGTALIAGAAALVALPALLAVLGPRIDGGTIRKRLLRAGEGRGFWYRSAIRVMRRPLVVAIAVIAAFVVAGIPSLRLNPGLLDDRSFGHNAEVRVTGDILRSEFSGREGTPISVVVPNAGSRPRAALEGYAARLARVEGVVRVETATGAYTRVEQRAIPPGRADSYLRGRSAWLAVIGDREPLSDAGAEQIAAIRAVPSPFHRVLVTGEAANVTDVTERIVDTVPRTLVFVAVAGFIALMLQFGSVIAPAIAVLLTTLSIGAMYGLIVPIFQEGHLSDLLGFTSIGMIYVNLPIVIFCFAFGLAMDYQVFILSRIKEEFDRTGRHEESIALGMGRSGPIVTAAAVLIGLVFLSTAVFSTTQFGKMLGLGLGFIVLLDAFVVRGTLVPALMKLAGRHNWWAPGWIKRLSDRLGMAEG